VDLDLFFLITYLSINIQQCSIKNEYIKQENNDVKSSPLSGIGTRASQVTKGLTSMRNSEAKATKSASEKGTSRLVPSCYTLRFLLI
jgi:hypothetical protein